MLRVGLDGAELAARQDVVALLLELRHTGGRLAWLTISLCGAHARVAERRLHRSVRDLVESGAGEEREEREQRQEESPLDLAASRF